jgi:uncharacterized membrane protein YjjP (DUF1212 family)
LKVRELERKAKEESERLEGEMVEWSEFYERFKSRLDELSSYEARIRELENELEERKRLVKIDLERKKYEFAILTALYAVVTILLMRMMTKFDNPWYSFGTGVLAGVGFAYLTRYWINIL